MDGDSHKRRKYDSPTHMTGAGIGQQHTMRQLSGDSIDRFRQPQPPGQPRPSAPDNSIQPPGRGNSLSSFGFEYAESPSYNPSSFQGGGPLQSGSLQYQQDFTPAPSRQHTSQATQQHHDQPGQPHRIQQQQQYDQSMVYNVAQQAQQQSPYDVATNYQPRHSAAIEVLANQFGVPQYFPPDDTGGAGGPGQYLTAQVQPAQPYSQPPSAIRPNTATTFPDAMPEFNPPVASSETLEAQELQRENPKIDDTFNQYQQTLRQTFEYTRSGHVVEASHLVLEISEWLLGNVVELGLARDEQERHADRIKLWNEFNTCWLALCQKQKDMTLMMLESRSQPNNLLNEDTLSKMGKKLVRLCDRVEQYGLVDYQMGVWEEEILSVLCQCVELLEQENEPRPTTSRQNRQILHGDPTPSC